MLNSKRLRFLLAAALAAPLSLYAANNQILGWNNLGMHCMDSDYSVFSVLPPYNTIEAQLIVNGKLAVSSNGYTITYQAVADPSGSITTTAAGKGNFYQYAEILYGATNLPVDMGLAGWAMPGPGNVPQLMAFEVTNQPAAGVVTPVNWWRAEGIPLSPYDDNHQQNPYPLMRLIARDPAQQPIATNDIVLPVSDEMDCRACHASGTQAPAQPAAGWVWDGLPERDYRLNILRLHDERQFALHSALYASALAARGFNPAGLYRGVVADNHPVLCAACHLSEALPNTGFPGIPPLTASVHAFHASVGDPLLNTTLDDAGNRAACYRCHPGSTTKCLRGAMGAAVAPDGSAEMQCQSCHGNMSAVGASDRTGWFDEPSCQSCHTGTATHNNGAIRYTSVFEASGAVRQAVDQTFATQTNTPAPDLWLYRFSAGHGGLQCEACHGSTHAVFPTTHVNDNLRNIELQGHAGAMVECASCHVTTPSTVSGGPHGMHPVGQNWVDQHSDAAEGNSSQCKVCHGTDYRGTVLSRMQADRTLTAFGTHSFFRGAIIGCYTCHNGPGSENANSSPAPTVSNLSTNTTNDKAVAMTLAAPGAGLRIISQPGHGSVGLNTTTSSATYLPNPGFVGTDTFTFADYDGSKNSNLGTGTVVVAQGPFSLGATAQAPPTYPAGWPAPFVVVPLVTNSLAPVTFNWDFGDGTPHGTGQYATHAYAVPGTYQWSVVSTVSTASTTNRGTMVITGPVAMATVPDGPKITLSWPITLADAVLEGAGTLDPGAQWMPVTNAISMSAGSFSVALPSDTGTKFFRLRRAW